MTQPSSSQGDAVDPCGSDRVVHRPDVFGDRRDRVAEQRAHRGDQHADRVDRTPSTARTLGIDSIGTNALEMNVSGKMMTNPMPITASGDRTRMPNHKPIQMIAEANTSSSASASITSRTGACVRQPMTRPEPSKMTIGEDRPEHLGEVVTEEVRRSPRRQRPEAVDHTFLKVGGDRHRRTHHRERQRLDEDAADEVFLVAAAARP